MPKPLQTLRDCAGQACLAPTDPPYQTASLIENVSKRGKVNGVTKKVELICCL